MAGPFLEATIRHSEKLPNNWSCSGIRHWKL